MLCLGDVNKMNEKEESRTGLNNTVVVIAKSGERGNGFHNIAS